MALTLVIANKAYSSWSFRPWILMRQFEIPFEEAVVPLGRPQTRAEMLRHSPAGKCPILKDGEILVWESLAIVEYLAESFPGLAIWPRKRAARAHARALSAEMHAGFTGLRALAPMNMRRAPSARPLTAEASADVARLEDAFARARAAHGEGGPFLFGRFCAVDAMFAPVVNRLYAYAIPVGAPTRAYMEAMMTLPAWREWVEGAFAEHWIIDDYEKD
ncbi:glutathione S-transferase family protein [Methylocella sp.]|uniref:glutathione S-transferase family protein n=1 Tax=Methylocella sp. TaxID=1978226 RepID=UPI0035B3A727